jgi:predicted glycoside hydrolase/deacetylase ChbG (UPF0249 family)
VDAGAFEASDHGIVTSVSLIVSGSTAAEAAKQAAERPDLALGLHLCFANRPLVCGPDEVPTLYQHGRPLPSVFRLAVRRLAPADLRREAEAQLARFVALTGAAPAFVNTEQHAQLLPSVLRTVIDLCQAHGIERTRLPAELAPRPNRRPRSWLWPLASLAARRDRPRLQRAGLGHPDCMLGGPESGRLTTPLLHRLLDSQWSGTAELVVHPLPGTAELVALTSDLSRVMTSIQRIPFHAL